MIFFFYFNLSEFFQLMSRAGIKKKIGKSLVTHTSFALFSFFFVQFKRIALKIVHTGNETQSNKMSLYRKSSSFVWFSETNQTNVGYWFYFLLPCYNNDDNFLPFVSFAGTYLCTIIVKQNKYSHQHHQYTSTWTRGLGWIFIWIQWKKGIQTNLVIQMANICIWTIWMNEKFQWAFLCFLFVV